jgi:predicted transcriptional regulator
MAERGLTPEATAELCNVDVASLYRVRDGSKRPTLQQAYRISAGLKLWAEDVFPAAEILIET